MSKHQKNKIWPKIKRFLADFILVNIVNKLQSHGNETKDKDENFSTGKTSCAKTNDANSVLADTLADSKAPKSSETNIETKTKTETQTVKDLETILYNELQKDPAAMLALKDLTNGQIPVSKANQQFEKVRNSEVALTTMVNSVFTPPDIKSKARAELQKILLKKLEAEEKLKLKQKPPAPKPHI